MTRPAGIPGSTLLGPFPVGAYAAKLRDELRKRARVQLFGEVWGFKASKARVYFELRDGEGALPCAMWRNEFDALGAGALADGARVVVAGGPDYYPGSRSSSPHFSFDVTALRLAGEGDLLAQLDLLRKRLDAEGLFAPQKRLARVPLPRTIGVVTGESGKARDDVLAGLRRRGWAGRLVWAFAPVQDRHAAPAIARALQDLSACRVDVIVVARGGGSLADLFCFCDETLCRTVALLQVPVIASVGHHTDRTLLDDVAAESCSTPTHAAEAAVPRHCDDARTQLAAFARRLEGHGRRAVLDRARLLARMSRAPAQHVARQRLALHQSLRELRAAGRRGLAERSRRAERHALVLSRKGAATAAEAARGATLERLRIALDAHDPARTLDRGYALVTDGAGEVVTSARAARHAATVRLRFADAAVDATISDRDPTP
ncbi:exodeoxyribonuclease VII large subunit [Capillimicrobium parvum]|uniref:Exodeoxyribonuclease 7 large subunit n=1 Tax=Capillimicrobium parvum TaxID=2884022 RepID=A0A9E6Y0U9_9ACTN|nr:exodeoxyribonuclease VII large subunit [Capillimicrobium parvum]UGS37870.1 Exodeoxyribonuclease 7 large subunit [Capillimicrobium parvum]